MWIQTSRVGANETDVERGYLFLLQCAARKSFLLDSPPTLTRPVASVLSKSVPGNDESRAFLRATKDEQELLWQMLLNYFSKRPVKQRWRRYSTRASGTDGTSTKYVRSRDHETKGLRVRVSSELLLFITTSRYFCFSNQVDCSEFAEEAEISDEEALEVREASFPVRKRARVRHTNPFTLSISLTNAALQSGS